MKCNICGQEFGNGAYCQHCNADRITALGNYSGGYNAPDAPKNVFSNTNTRGNNQTSGYGSNNDPNNSSERSGVGNSGEQFMVCYNCANVIPVDSEYCPCCRIKLYEVCPKCGHRYSSQYKICNKCGTDREEYLAEQRLLEQRRQEEARRKEAEHKKVLEEERRRERQRLEEERRRAEERQRQLEAKRREEERQKEEAQRREAELIRRIESSDAYKEAYEWLTETISINWEKVNRKCKYFVVSFYMGLALMVIFMIILIAADDHELWLWIYIIYMICFVIYANIIHKLFNPDNYIMRLFEHSFSHKVFHNHLAKQAVKRYFDELHPENLEYLTYNGELIKIFKEMITAKENKDLKF